MTLAVEQDVKPLFRPITVNPIYYIINNTSGGTEYRWHFPQKFILICGRDIQVKRIQKHIDRSAGLPLSYPLCHNVCVSSRPLSPRNPH